MPSGKYQRIPNQRALRLPDFAVSELREAAALGMSTRELGRLFGKSEEYIRKWMIRVDIPRLPAKARAERNYFWKGGTTVSGGGYQMVRTQSRYRQAHRLVMEQELGRSLRLHEVVDHIDGNRLNNDPSNLRLFENNAAHLAATLKGRCPDWTEQGRERMQSNCQRKAERADASLDRALRSGAPLNRQQRYRLRTALRTGRLSPSRMARWLAWAYAHPPWSGTKRQSELPY